MMCTQTVQDCQQRAFRLAFRITRNQEDAEDAQQEALPQGSSQSGPISGPRSLHHLDFAHRD